MFALEVNGRQLAGYIFISFLSDSLFLYEISIYVDIQGPGVKGLEGAATVL